jgi:hypothetical protein
MIRVCVSFLLKRRSLRRLHRSRHGSETTISLVANGIQVEKAYSADM